MNLAHYRKSKYSREETINNLKKFVEKDGFELIGEVSLSKANATMFQLCKEDWVDQIVTQDKNLVGLMPCNMIVMEKDGDVSVGIGNPAVMGGVTGSHDVIHLVSNIEEKLKKMLNEITGSEDPKPSKVKLYSTQTCPYCTMEKKWLEENKIEHKVVYVDQDQEAAQKMVQETGQMGVPVTEVEYDDENKEFIIGFDKQRLTSLLNLK